MIDERSGSEAAGVPAWKGNVRAVGALLLLVMGTMLITGWLWVQLLPDGLLIMGAGVGWLLIVAGASEEGEINKLRWEVDALRRDVDALRARLDDMGR